MTFPLCCHAREGGHPVITALSVRTGSPPARGRHCVCCYFPAGGIATATAIAVIRLREPDLNKAVGIVIGLALVVVYELAATLLAPYGAKGIVVTTFVALLLAGAGLLGTRQELHNALIAEAKLAAVGGQVARAADVDQSCAHCAAELGEGAAFCSACGTHSATLARPGNAGQSS